MNRSVQPNAKPSKSDMSQKSGTIKESKTIRHDDVPAHFGEQKIDIENSYDSFL
jgi:hypothetical protein